MKEIKREAEMRYDHSFVVNGNEELCHFTGWEVQDADGIWWGEFEDSQGNLHYGN